MNMSRIIKVLINNEYIIYLHIIFKYSVYTDNSIINDKYKLAGKYKKTGPSKYKPTEGLFHVYRQKTDSDGNIVSNKKINDRTIYYVNSVQK